MQRLSALSNNNIAGNAAVTSGLLNAQNAEAQGNLDFSRGLLGGGMQTEAATKAAKRAQQQQQQAMWGELAGSGLGIGAHFIPGYKG
jgi:hypothetical protein